MRLAKLLVIASALWSSSAQPLSKVTRNDSRTVQPLSKASNEAAQSLSKAGNGTAPGTFQPKVFVFAMFELERQPWLDELPFEHNITVPGLSPLYPDIQCVADYSICLATAGEGEINAAASVMAVTSSPLFDLTRTYWLFNGIAGGEPNHVTTGSATFAKYAVQVGLQYQVDYREYINTNPNWTSGYFGYGVDDPWEYPANVYGTEVFELNEKLRDRAASLATTRGHLSNGTVRNDEVRQMYEVEPAVSAPGVVKCDSLTSDNYFFGNVLGDYFVEYVNMITNGSATYCATAQEDNAVLEVMTRMDKHGLVDYNRIVVMRTISNFARPPPSMANDTVGFFNNLDKGGIQHSLDNLVGAGLPFVEDVISEWDSVYDSGVDLQPDNYVGDIFATLGGVPDFGKENFEVA